MREDTLLAIDTAGNGCGVAIARGERILAEETLALSRGHDVHLAGLTRAVLTKVGLSFDDIDGLGVCVGPGSFTGIRVGVSFARGLALALDRPCVGVTSLEALIGCAGPVNGRALALLPAKRRPPELSFWAQPIKDFEIKVDPFEIAMTDLVEQIETATIVVSTAEALQTLGDIVPEAKRCAVRPCVTGIAGFLARTGASQAGRPAVPVYGRAPDAAKPAGSLFTDG